MLALVFLTLKIVRHCWVQSSIDSADCLLLRSRCQDCQSIPSIEVNHYGKQTIQFNKVAHSQSSLMLSSAWSSLDKLELEFFRFTLPAFSTTQETFPRWLSSSKTTSLSIVELGKEAQPLHCSICLGFFFFFSWYQFHPKALITFIRVLLVRSILTFKIYFPGRGIEKSLFHISLKISLFLMKIISDIEQ